MSQPNQFRNRKTEAAKAQTTAALTQEVAKPVVSPAVKLDVQFGNEIIARRDQAIVEEQAARQQLEARRSQYERDMERLQALFRADEDALMDTISRCERVQEMSDAALEVANGSNVIPMERTNVL